MDSPDQLHEVRSSFPIQDCGQLSIIPSPYRYIPEADIKQAFHHCTVEFLPFEMVREVMSAAMSEYAHGISEMANSWMVDGMPIEKFLNYRGEFPAWWFTRITGKVQHGELGRLFFWEQLCRYLSDQGVSSHEVLFCTVDSICANVAERHGYSVVRLKSDINIYNSLKNFIARNFPSALTVFLMIQDLVYWTKAKLYCGNARIKQSYSESQKIVAYITEFNSNNWNNRGSISAYDRYFMDIPNQYLKNDMSGIVYAIIRHPSRKINKHLQINRYYKRIKPVFLLETLTDVMESVCFRLWCLRVVKKIALSKPIQNQSESESSIYLNNMIFSLLTSCPDVFRLYRALKKQFEREPVHKVITYIEFYIFGKAVSLAGLNTDTTVFGWQHCPIPYGKMQYIHTKYDLQNMPKPSAFLIWGAQARNSIQLLGNPLPDDYFIETGCARFGHLFEKIEESDTIDINNDSKIVLVIPSDQDALGLPRLILHYIAVFAAKNLKVYIKPHPTYGEKTKKMLNNAKYDSYPISIVEGDLAELIHNSRYVVTSNSAAAIESVLQGKPVLVTAFLVPPGICPYTNHQGSLILPVYSEGAFGTAIQEEWWFEGECIHVEDIRKEVAQYVVPFNNDLFMDVVNDA